LTWLLRQHRPDWAIQAAWADRDRFPRHTNTLAARIAWTVRLYPCDILFIHRDAERASRAVRAAEVRQALMNAEQEIGLPPAVCVIPVRMSEAWLLFDEAAIRRAAGNPRGRQPLDLPRWREIESLPDPKARLRSLVQGASGLTGRRLQRLRMAPALVADHIADFSPLRQLAAFQALEGELAAIL
jgi:hypothetical protein